MFKGHHEMYNLIAIIVERLSTRKCYHTALYEAEICHEDTLKCAVLAFAKWQR